MYIYGKIVFNFVLSQTRIYCCRVCVTSEMCKWVFSNELFRVTRKLNSVQRDVTTYFSEGFCVFQNYVRGPGTRRSTDKQQD